MIFDQWSQYRSKVQGLARIVIAFLFFTHGGQKLFGWFGAEGTVDLFTRMGIAGVLEVFGGLLLALGLFTRPVAFVLSGQMAVAYFWIHVQNGLWPWVNGGELAAIYCWIFLFFAAAGAGSFSLDGLMAKKNAAT